jgi:hypothetical protein
MKQSVANNNNLIFPSIDWLTKHAKIQKAKHKDIIGTVDYSINEVWQQGRQNTKIYEIFFDNFLPCVIKKLVFDRQVSIVLLQMTERFAL